MINNTGRWTCRLWMANRLAICLVAAWLLASLGVPGAVVPAATAPALSVSTNYYDVRGESAAALLSSMHARRSTTNDAFTQWTVTWNYRMQNDATGRLYMTRRAATDAPKGRSSDPRWISENDVILETQPSGFSTPPLFFSL